MTRLWVGILAGAGGVVVGLYIAKVYARTKVQGALDSTLNEIGLGGGKVQELLDGFIPQAVTG